MRHKRRLCRTWNREQYQCFDAHALVTTAVRKLSKIETNLQPSDLCALLRNARFCKQVRMLYTVDFCLGLASPTCASAGEMGPPVFATPAQVPLVTVQWLQAGHRTIGKTRMSSVIFFNNSLNSSVFLWQLVGIVCSCTNWILLRFGFGLVPPFVSLCILKRSPIPAILRFCLEVILLVVECHVMRSHGPFFIL